jgi:hypothetical protein
MSNLIDVLVIQAILCRVAFFRLHLVVPDSSWCISSPAFSMLALHMSKQYNEASSTSKEEIYVQADHC